MSEGKLPRVLTTKIVVPRVPPGLIDRPRFIESFEDAQSKRLTVIKAPAGFGKTSLAITWAERLRKEGNQVAWLALDADDDEPARFLYYTVHALRRACNGVGVAALGLTSEVSLVPWRTVISLLLNEFAELEDEIYLFLDDYHCITHDAIHEAMSFFLAYAPSNFHLVVATRSDPPLSLAKLRAQNELLEIDSACLRFDQEETRHFIESELCIATPATDLKTLQRTTEGWAAALRIAASSLAQGKRNFTQFVHTLSGASRPIGDYLQEMLASLPNEMAQYMLRTSILDRLTAPLCRAVTGNEGSQELLESIARRQMLLDSLDLEGRWYRYHPLLAEYLSQQLQSQFAHELPDLHRRAYHWCASEELWVDAVKHALAAGDTEQAMTFVTNCAMPLLRNGDLLTLLNWQRKLPKELMRGQVKVRLAIVWGMTLAMRFEQALELLAEIEQDVGNDESDKAKGALWECQAVRSVLVALQDDSQIALSLAEDAFSQPSWDDWITNVLSNVIRFGHWKAGNLERLYATPWRPCSREQDKRNVLASVYRCCLHGLAEREQIRLGVAERHFAEGMRLAEEAVGPQSTSAALCAPLIAQIYYEQGRVDDAEAMIEDRLPTINATVLLDGVLTCYLVLERIAQLRGNVERAYALLDQAELLGYERHWDRLVAAAVMERARLYLKEGRLAEASASLMRLDRLAAECSCPSLCAWSEIHYYRLLGAVHLAVAQNRLEDAVAGLNRLVEEAENGQRHYFALRLRLLLTTVLLGANERASALETFNNVLNVAAPAGVFQSIVDHGPEMRTLLGEARKDAEHADSKERLDYIDRLLDGWHARHQVQPEQDGHGTADSLSSRERNVLELIAQGQSNKEVARALGIAPETVKSHVKNIFAKLNVDKRAHAVMRAQVLNILKSG